MFPSVKEGWGISNVEASACGTPTIAADSPGLRESVIQEETGLLVPYGDHQALDFDPVDHGPRLGAVPARAQ